jgi:hypothetical protein
MLLTYRWFLPADVLSLLPWLGPGVVGARAAGAFLMPSATGIICTKGDARRQEFASQVSAHQDGL